MNFLLDQFFAQFLPLILAALSTILTTVLVRASGIIKERWGIEIEATHREALHSALMSGIQAALERGETSDQAVSSAVTYANESVPDAIKALPPYLYRGHLTKRHCFVQWPCRQKVYPTVPQLQINPMRQLPPS